MGPYEWKFVGSVVRAREDVEKSCCRIWGGTRNGMLLMSNELGTLEQ
jgi:hypothetical protein